MLKWTLRVIITVVDGLLVMALWLVTHPVSTPPPDMLSVNVEEVTPEEVEFILDATGYDEDGGILNEDNQ
ncbi:MAG: hypothetical protein HY565_04905 [Candidatus Kerfeldbacteria bacterium]|nr:hypothetical protein [Candidatus Kerfeldbacteria bacterium]